MLNLKEHKQAYDTDQDVYGIKIKTGTYHVVGTTVQRRTNAKGTKSIRIQHSVLAAKEDENKSAVGSNFSVDRWADFSKKGNVQALAFQVMANAYDGLDNYNPESDDTIVDSLTGTPFTMRVEVTEEQGLNGRKFTRIEVRECKEMPLANRKKYTERPDWSQAVPSRAKRLLDPFVAEKGAYGGGPSSQGGSPLKDPETPVFDDDLPF